jgi:hypothetical protein
MGSRSSLARIPFLVVLSAVTLSIEPAVARSRCGVFQGSCLGQLFKRFDARGACVLDDAPGPNGEDRYAFCWRNGATITGGTDPATGRDSFVYRDSRGRVRVRGSGVVEDTAVTVTFERRGRQWTLRRPREDLLTMIVGCPAGRTETYPSELLETLHEPYPPLRCHGVPSCTRGRCP